MKLKQVALIGSAIICLFATSALAAQMSVEPVHQEAFQSDNIMVNITVATEGAEDVYAASYALYFNNTLLNATSLEKGSFLSQDGNPSNMQYPPTGINNTAGVIKYGEYRVGDVPGITGYGVLSTITFQVIGEEGISQLNLGELDLALLYSAPPTYAPVPTTTNNGTCEIGDVIKQTPTPTPTPTATIATASVQTPTAMPITPAPPATVIRTPATLPSPSPSPPLTIVTSPTTTASKLLSEEESEENNKLSGFNAVFTIIGLFILLILKRKNVIE